MEKNINLILDAWSNGSSLTVRPRIVFRIILLISLTSIFGCTKDKGKLIPNTTPVLDQDFVCEDTAFDWSGVPPVPDFDFILWSKWGKDAPWRVIYDPNDENVIYYTTSEPNNANHILWRYDRKKNVKTLVDEQVLNDVQINKNGWLIYEKIDLNIYKIKTNGDSLTQLTVKGNYLFPSWSEDGQYIFYDDNYHGRPGKSVIKAYSNGVIVDTLENIGKAVSLHNRKNFYYFTDQNGAEFFTVQLDINTGIRRTIVSKENNMGSDIGYCYTDLANENLYWYSYNGLYRTNLQTLRTVRLINGGYHSKNNLLHYQQSPINGRFIAIQFITAVVNPYTLLGSSKIVEFKPDGICRRTLELPN